MKIGSYAAVAIGTVVFSLALVVSLLLVGFGIFVYRDIWYFPGDPPFIDIALWPATISFLLGTSFVALGLRYRPNLRHVSLRSVAFAILMALSFASFAICVGGIAFRHTSRWSDIRKGIRFYGEEIARAAGDKDRVLSSAEFDYYRKKYMPSPVVVPLPGFGDVHLRMAHGVYPYVGVDFGHGQNAHFSPMTMLCTYSD